jgi:hypothetical protein
MTNKEIRKYKQKQRDALSKETYTEIQELLKSIAKELRVKLPDGMPEIQRNHILQINSTIYDAIQTEEMFNACVSAKWSCFWAAIAAIASCISVLLVLFCA